MAITAVFPDRYEQTPSDDPIWLYEDVPVGIMPEIRLNNGQPSFVVSLISVGRLQAGERVAHISAGQGYYTAVMSRLVGSRAMSRASNTKLS